MKRFTATEKWNKAWFQELSLSDKCLWNYLCDNCDPAGVWDANWRLASFQIGATFTAESLAVYGGRIEFLPDGKVWIVAFCEFQYGQLSRDCRAQNHVFRALEKHGLLDRVSSLFNTLSNRLPDSLQETDKDKEGDKDKDGKGDAGAAGGGGDKPPDPAAEKKKALVAISVRIGALFHRRPDTRWGDKEKQALAKLYPMPEDDLRLMERYYTVEISSDKDIRRRDLQTLLNNWTGELDRARKHFGVVNPPAANPTLPPEKVAAFLAVPEHAEFQNINPIPTSRSAMPPSMRAVWDTWYAKNR